MMVLPAPAPRIATLRSITSGPPPSVVGNVNAYVPVGISIDSAHTVAFASITPAHRVQSPSSLPPAGPAVAQTPSPGFASGASAVLSTRNTHPLASSPTIPVVA